MGQLKVTKKKKTPVLWTIEWKEVEQSVLKGGGMIRNSMATKSNKKQQKTNENGQQGGQLCASRLYRWDTRSKHKSKKASLDV